MAKKLLSELKGDIEQMQDREVQNEILLNLYLARKAGENTVKAVNSVKWTIILLIVLCLLAGLISLMAAAIGA